jgi:hypothetical protein
MSSSFVDFLKKIKWIDHSELSFNMDQREFVDRLKEHLGPYRPQGMFEAFSGGPDYVGKIEGNEITMRRKRKIFDWTMGAVIIDAKLKEKNGSVQVDALIQFPRWMPVMIISFFGLMYGLAFILLITGVFATDVPLLGLFIIIHFVVLFSIFYFLFRIAIQSAKHHYERDMTNYFKQK